MLWRQERRRPKVFCIGRNKTGTTSLEAVFKRLGYRVGNQRRGERLIEDWVNGEFRRIIRLCRTADAFQDIPFSLPRTYEAVDQVFPGSRFILTVRGSAAEWFDSLVRFHANLLGETPSASALQQSSKWRWIWRTQQLVYGANEATAYDPGLYKAHYEQHNASVREYFRERPGDLLVLNLRDNDAAERLSVFLREPIVNLPHLNRSA